MQDWRDPGFSKVRATGNAGSGLSKGSSGSTGSIAASRSYDWLVLRIFLCLQIRLPTGPGVSGRAHRVDSKRERKWSLGALHM